MRDEVCSSLKAAASDGFANAMLRHGCCRRLWRDFTLKGIEIG